MLKRVTDNDFDFLYQMLEIRESHENISHKKMPNFREHKKFCKSSPYQFWYIIYDNKTKMGTAYLSKLDEIAIHLLPNFKKEVNYSKILKILIKKHPKSRYLVNISNKNKKLMKTYMKNNFKLIQYTFELQKK
tara:strand:- start:3129 stop:3527 length:399 start_codon:yes stop_codon:yes gene_type:complete